MKPLPHLNEREVHLYRLLLPGHTAEIARLAQHLTPDEAERAARLKTEQLKNRFVTVRGLLREILGSYLGIAPTEVPLLSGEQGKPYLAEPHEAMRFNLSHSGDFCLIACTSNRNVGVDIELMTPGKPLHDMARLVFSRNEQEELFRLPDPAFELAFHRCWVRKEACLKACGTGFSLPANSFDITTSLGNKESVVSCNRKKWHVLEIDSPNDFCAAVAVERLMPGEKTPRIVWRDVLVTSRKSLIVWNSRPSS